MSRIHISLLALFAGASTALAATVTVRPFEHRHPFITGGAGFTLYVGHINSMSAANREMTYDWLFKDLNLGIIRPSFKNSESVNDNSDPYVLNMPTFEVTGSHDTMAALILEALKRNPRTVSMPYCSSFPDYLVNTNAEGDVVSLKLNEPGLDFYAEYAEWLYGNMVYFKNLGVDTQILDLFNEPNASWNPYLNESICADIVANTVPILRQIVATNYPTYGIEMPQVCAPSNLGPGSARTWLTEWKNDKPATWTNFDIFSTHPYGAGGVGFDYSIYKGIADLKDEHHWRFIQNEMEFGHQSFRDNGDDPLPIDALEGELEGALALARVFSISVLAGATDFMVFQGNGPQPLENAKQLVRTPWGGTPVRTKGYYVYKMLTTTQPYGSDVVDRTLSGAPTGFHANTFHKWGDNRVFVTVVNATTNAEPCTIRFRDHDNQDIPISYIDDYETSASHNIALVGETNFIPTVSEWTTSIETNSVRSFIVHLTSSAVAADKVTYLRETKNSELNTTPQDGDTNPDREFLVGYNGNGARGTSKGLMRGQLEFDLSDFSFPAGLTFDSSELVMTAYRGTVRSSAETGGDANVIAYDLYEYMSGFVETNSTWVDPDGDGIINSGDTVAGGTLGSLLASSAIINGDDGDYNANGASEVFSLPVSINGSALDSAVAGAVGNGKLRMLVDPNEAIVDAWRYLGFYDDEAAKSEKCPPRLVLSTTGSPPQSLLANGGFEAEPYTAGWNISGSGYGEVTGLDTSVSAIRLPWNRNITIAQDFAPQRDFTLNVVAEISGTSENAFRMKLKDSSGGTMLHVRTAGGSLRVYVGGQLMRVVDAGSATPAAWTKDEPYEIQLVGRGFGTPLASWDISWWPQDNPDSISSITDIRAFTDASLATSGTGLAELAFEQVGSSANSCIIDGVSLWSAEGAAPAPTHEIENISGPEAHFLQWSANEGVNPALGYNTIANLDSDADEIKALLEYAFGLDLSTVQVSSDLMDIQPLETGVVVSIVVRDDDPNLGIAVENSPDLSGWGNLPEGNELSGVDQTGVPVGMRRRSFVLPSEDASFARIRAGIE